MKKIMFKDEYGLTDAVLDSRKTTTRRVIADKDEIDAMVYARGSVEKKMEYLLGKSRYKIGEVVAVVQRGIDIYHALQKRYGQTSDAALGFKEMYEGMPMWNNKMFVPADLCPSRIRITDIKVERLQDISDEDCIYEGVTKSRFNDFPNEMYFPYKQCKDTEVCYTPRYAFQILIDKVSGKGIWERNPWVFAYSFELVK